jgi:hypothetical protein
MTPTIIVDESQNIILEHLNLPPERMRPGWVDDSEPIGRDVRGAGAERFNLMRAELLRLVERQRERDPDPSRPMRLSGWDPFMNWMDLADLLEMHGSLQMFFLRDMSFMRNGRVYAGSAVFLLDEVHSHFGVGYGGGLRSAWAAAFWDLLCGPGSGEVLDLGGMRRRIFRAKVRSQFEHDLGAVIPQAAERVLQLYDALEAGECELSEESSTGP